MGIGKAVIREVWKELGKALRTDFGYGISRDKG